MNNYSFTNIKFQIDSTNKLIIESIKNGNSEIGKLPKFDTINSEVDINETLLKVDKYFKWDTVAYNNKLYKPFIDECNSKVKAIRNSMNSRATEDFFNLKSQIDELVTTGGINEKDAIGIITNQYQGMRVTYKDGSTRDLNHYLDIVYRTQSSNAARARSEEVARNLNLKVYRLSTHSNPRLTCNVIQSSDDRLFSFEKGIKFKGKLVKNASEADYGKPGGLGGVHCNHFWVGVQDFGDLKREVPNVKTFSNPKSNPKYESKLSGNLSNYIRENNKLNSSYKNGKISKKEFDKKVKSNNSKYETKQSEVFNDLTKKGGDDKNDN